jgi:DNA-binding transcriptional ArsR family regulator
LLEIFPVQFAVDSLEHIDYDLFVNRPNSNKKLNLLNVKVRQGNGCVTCFSSLGISSRMSIYKYLRSTGKSTVSAVVAQIGLTQPTISYHLNEMKNAGILKSERSGKEVYYMIDDECKVFHRDCVLKGVQFAN